jgi:hypothetical protein
LGNLIALGGAGGVSFAHQDAGIFGGYWQVWVVDPNNAANVIAINENLPPSNTTDQFTITTGIAFAALETLKGVTTFDSAYCINTSWCGSSSLIWPNGNAAQLWTQIENVVVDGTALADWSVSAMAIATGGYNNTTQSIVDITSITVPSGPAPVSEPSPLMIVIGGGLLLFLLREGSRLGSAVSGRL